MIPGTEIDRKTISREVTRALYPIAETFTSIQGEGLWAGTRMTFIRFAGCNVGKPIKDDADNNLELRLLLLGDGDSHLTKTGWKLSEKYGQLPVWQEECTLYDGRKFCCDTDFRVKERLTIREILECVPSNVDHICLTGGEPLIHNLSPLIGSWFMMGKDFHSVHIETSGTKEFNLSNTGFPDASMSCWITVSPKKDALAQTVYRADEIKLLVDENFNVDKANEVIFNKKKDCIVWLSPVNGNDSINYANVKRCLDLIEKNPTWRLTWQTHKLAGVR